MNRLTPLVISLLIALVAAGCEPNGSPATQGNAKQDVAQDQSSGQQTDSDESKNHNAITANEDPASTQRRMKARESLGFKNPTGKSDASSNDASSAQGSGDAAPAQGDQ